MSKSERTLDKQAAKDAVLIGERLATLRTVSAEFADLLGPDLSDRSSDVAHRADARIGQGTRNTVVALAGSTGSGKSSLFNALAQQDLATTGVRRPTTSTAEAVTFAPGADDLLAWLEISRHHRLHNDDLQGLVLVDLPDHDSIVDDHRQEVDRLAEVTDVFCWVVDPQKYADAALHDDYLKRFARHGAVTVVALNQVDRLTQSDRVSCVDHLRRLLTEDGLQGVRVIETSTVTGEGVDELRRELTAKVAERRAAVARLDADIDWVANDLLVSCGDRNAAPLQQRDVNDVSEAFARAAGVDAVAAAVASSHQMRSRSAIGWPVTKWAARLKPDPLRRLGLGKPTDFGKVTPAINSPARRSSMGEPSKVAQAELTTALRDVVDAASIGLPDRWRDHLATSIVSEDIGDQLDVAITSADLHTKPPRWWRFVGALQWVLAICMVVGFGWLVIKGLVTWAGLPDLPEPTIGRLGVPTWLLIGGALSGLVIAGIGGVMASVAAKNRSRLARQELVAACKGVARTLVVEPMNHELERMDELSKLANGLAKQS